MSKRRGDFVTLDELLDEIGVDATRFFMLRARTIARSTSILSSRASQSAENPVYYIQYAHARIASMLRRLADERVERRAERRRTGAAVRCTILGARA